MNSRCDILIVGGGTGGCAAALSAASMGCRVILTEITDWLGGQLTSQIVPPDEHPWIEQFGCTARYRGYREGVRQYYRDHFPLTAKARADRFLNPGGGNVSPVCHEPRVGVAVIEQMMSYARSTGRLEVRLRVEPLAVETHSDTVRAVTFRNHETGGTETISARYILDATELVDLLPMAQVEYVSGAESQKETDEPHAVAGAAEPDNVQSFTWCFPVGFDPDGEHVTDQPAQYAKWRDFTPEMKPHPWPGKLFSWTTPLAQENHRDYTQTLFRRGDENLWSSLWLYRRLVTRDHFAPGDMPHEITLVNWAQNDYIGGNIIDKPEAEVAQHLANAKQLSLSLLYWLQTEASRPEGGVGYPELYLRPDISGTSDGLAKAPYIRESRRIRAQFTVTENHISQAARAGKFAEPFADSVGVGQYSIDIHGGASQKSGIHIPTFPFQIPLGALLPVRVENLLPAAKNLGVTHIANGAYRLHPVEWNIGESAGLLAAFALSKKVPPRAVREKAELLTEFQSLLQAQGVELAWPWARYQ